MSKVPTILERINALESTLTQVQRSTDGNLNQFRSALSNVVEVVSALVEVSGGKDLDDKVQAKLQERQDAKAAAEAQKAKDVLKQLVDAGTLAVADTITEESIIIGREFDKEGNVVAPGYVQVQFSQFVEDAKKALLGQGPGFVYETNGTKFEVTDVYVFAPQKPMELQKAPELAPGEEAVAADLEPATSVDTTEGQAATVAE